MNNETKNETLVKQLFIIDGYRIWAYTYEEALEYHKMIERF